MQRTVSVSSSAHKPPRPPSRIRVPNRDTYLRDEFRDIEKGEKEKWRIKAEQLIHLIPAVLLLCLLILYICSSVPFQGHDLLRDDATHLKNSEKTVASERHLQQTRVLQVGIKSTNSGTVEQPKLDYQRHQSNSERQPLLLRGTVK